MHNESIDMFAHGKTLDESNYSTQKKRGRVVSVPPKTEHYNGMGLTAL